MKVRKPDLSGLPIIQVYVCRCLFVGCWKHILSVTNSVNVSSSNNTDPDLDKDLRAAMRDLKVTLVDVMRDEKVRIQVAIKVAKSGRKKEVGAICGFSKRHTFRLLKKYGLEQWFYDPDPNSVPDTPAVAPAVARDLTEK